MARAVWTLKHRDEATREEGYILLEAVILCIIMSEEADAAIMNGEMIDSSRITIIESTSIINRTRIDLILKVSCGPRNYPTTMDNGKCRRVLFHNGMEYGLLMSWTHGSISVKIIRFIQCDKRH